MVNSRFARPAWKLLIASLFFLSNKGPSETNSCDDASTRCDIEAGFLAEAVDIREIKALANAGNPRGQYQLGHRLLQESRINSPEATEGVSWLMRAADQDENDAKMELASLYLEGKHVPWDARRSFDLVRSAAVGGNGRAMFSLAWRYQDGVGVRADPVLAFAWATLANKSPDEDWALAGRILKDAYARSLSTQQQREGRQLSSSWRIGHDISRTASHPTSPRGSTEHRSPISRRGAAGAFSVSTDGYILTTARAVMNDCEQIRIAGYAGRVALSRVDESDDLALVKIESMLPVAAPIAGGMGPVKQGQEIMVYSYPPETTSSDGTVTSGVISALTGMWNNPGQFRITMSPESGSTASTVIDDEANVVGLVIPRNSDNSSFELFGIFEQDPELAVKASTIRQFLENSGLPYRSGGRSWIRRKSTTDIAHEARYWTYLVECWR